MGRRHKSISDRTPNARYVEASDPLAKQGELAQMVCSEYRAATVSLVHWQFGESRVLSRKESIRRAAEKLKLRELKQAQVS